MVNRSGVCEWTLLRESRATPSAKNSPPPSHYVSFPVANLNLANLPWSSVTLDDNQVSSIYVTSPAPIDPFLPLLFGLRPPQYCDRPLGQICRISLSTFIANMILRRQTLRSASRILYQETQIWRAGLIDHWHHITTALFKIYILRTPLYLPLPTLASKRHLPGSYSKLSPLHLFKRRYLLAPLLLQTNSV